MSMTPAHSLTYPTAVSQVTGLAASFLDFAAVGGTSPVFTVTPNPCGNYGSPVSMTATGSNTDWTPGTPGSPTFTVDHGTLSSQVVSAAGAATFTYDPGSFLGTATFTDPSSGAVCYVLVTSDPYVAILADVCFSGQAIPW